MSLQFILGGSGAGKSHYLYSRIIEEAKENEKKNYFVIVPEQFTMETQKDFVTLHGNHGIINIDVSSFMRLAYRIMEETSMGGRPVLEDTGKNMVLRRVLEEKKEELIYFKSNIKKPGFVDEIKSMLSEFYQYSIGEEELEEMISLSANKPMLEAKLKDLYLIYQGFREFLKEKYITAEEVMDVLYEALEHSDLIRDSIICFDGFTGFTPSQYKVLERIFALSDQIYVTVTIREDEDISRKGEEFQLFHLSRKTISRLRKLADEKKVEVLPPVYPEKKNGVLWRFRESKALAALEENLFRHPLKTFSGEQDSIFLNEFGSPTKEALFVISKIKEMVRKDHYRYRDFAVVTADMNGYGRILETAFKEAEIPFFLDDKREITKNPLIRFINSILSLGEQNMDYESMIHYLRSPILSFSKEELDMLDNYCLAFGIRGKKRWSNAFTKTYENMKEEDLTSINAIRERVMEGLEGCGIFLSKKRQKAELFVEALYDILVKTNAYECLMEYRKQFEEAGDYLIAKEYEQVYKKVMELLERLMELLPEEEMTVKEFRDILNAGFQKVKVGLIPSGIDQVVIGDIERTRLKNVKVLFFIGVNDGIVPKAAESGGILSDTERELLKEKKVELAPGRREKIYTERFYLYLNLTKPENKTFLTFSKVGMDGKTSKPSYLIGKIKQLFLRLSVTEETEFEDDLEFKMDADKGKECLLNGIRDYEPRQNGEKCFEIIYSWYYKDEKLKKNLIKILEMAFPNEKSGKISRAVAKVLYGENFNGSITRLEQFAACACAHFLSYGLHLKERQEFKLKVPDMGNIFHEALERFSKKMQERNLTFRTIAPEEREQLAEECVLEITGEYGNSIFHSTKRSEYTIERISRILKRTLWALTEQLSAGDFEPKGYEIKFSFMDELDSVKLPLSNGGRMNLTGRIDRVDLCEKEDEIYVKVMDYKSGKKTFDILDTYYGLQLQLVVYMEAMLEKTARDNPDKKVTPGGVFYYNIEDPLVERTQENQKDLDILKELRMNGLVNEKKEILKSLDAVFADGDAEGLKQSVKSKVIPVETVKSGELSKTSSVVKTEDFELLIQFVREKMKELGDEILEGNCEKNPYQLGDRTACDYCKFAGACGFDKKLPQYQYRRLDKLNKDLVLEKIRKSVKTED